MPGRDDDQPSGAPEWMCTFADMMSLLLCFFVLLFSISSIDNKQYIQAQGSLRGAFGGLPAPHPVENIPDKKSPPEMSRPMQKEKRISYAQQELVREMEQKIRSTQLQETIQVTGTEEGITFRLSGDALFDTGSAALKAEALAALQLVASELIRFTSNPITIEGHTDLTNQKNNPNTNWLLGAERAYTVLRYLVDWGDIPGRLNEDRITYESYAEFDPLPDTDPSTAIGKKLNRRVDIILLQTDEGNGTYFTDPDLEDPRTPLTEISRNTRMEESS